jgi:predicted transcriptional regulator
MGFASDWHRSPGYADLLAALAACGHPGKDEDELATLDVRERFRVERAWTRRMQDRCGIDPFATPTEVSAQERTDERMAREDAAIARVERPTDFPVGGRGVQVRSLGLEARVLQLTAQGFAAATIARTLSVTDSTVRKYLARAIGEMVHAGKDVATLAARYHRDTAWVERAAAEHTPVESDYAVQVRARTEQVVALVAAGVMHRVIAERLGITRQRIGQILDQHRRRQLGVDDGAQEAA